MRDNQHIPQARRNLDISGLKSAALCIRLLSITHETQVVGTKGAEAWSWEAGGTWETWDILLALKVSGLSMNPKATLDAPWSHANDAMNKKHSGKTRERNDMWALFVFSRSVCVILSVAWHATKLYKGRAKYSDTVLNLLCLRTETEVFNRPALSRGKEY